MARQISDLTPKKSPPNLGLKLGLAESESCTDGRLRSILH